MKLNLLGGLVVSSVSLCWQSGAFRTLYEQAWILHEVTMAEDPGSITFTPEVGEPYVVDLDEWKISVEHLMQMFPQACVLKYKVPPKPQVSPSGQKEVDKVVIECILPKDDIYFLVQGVSEYTVLMKSVSDPKKNFSENQKATFDGLTSIMRNQGRKDMDLELQKQSETQQKVGGKPKPRKLKFVWKHRDSKSEFFNRIRPSAPHQIVEIPKGYTRTAIEIKGDAVKLFSHPLTGNFFNPKYTTIELGTSGNKVIPHFPIVSGKESFEKFAQKEMDEKHRLELHLLTTILPEVTEDLTGLVMNSDKCSTDSPEKKTPNKENVQRHRESIHGGTIQDGPGKVFTSPIKNRQISAINNIIHVDSANDQEPIESDLWPLTKCTQLSSELQKSDQVNRVNQLISEEIDNKNKTEASAKDDVLFKIPLSKRQKLIELQDMKCSSVISILRDDLILSNTSLGEGAFGEVRLGEWQSTPVAVKMLEMKRASMKSLTREVSTMSVLHHPNIALLMGTSYDEKYFHIVMENIEGHDLRSVIFDEKVRQTFNLQNSHLLSIAIQAFTDLNFPKGPIHHRDIKSGDIMLTYNYVVKICDLGMAKTRSRSSSCVESTDGRPRPIGTLIYMAPEVLLALCQFFAECDIWSLACIINELFKKELTWTLNPDNEELADDWIEMETKFKGGELPDLNHVHKDLQPILRKCLFYEYLKENKKCIARFLANDTKRPSALKVLKALPERLSSI